MRTNDFIKQSDLRFERENMIKALFFDVGGVLIEDNSAEILKRQSLLLDISYRMLRDDMRPDRILLMKGVIAHREYLRRLAKKFQLPPIKARSLRRLFRRQRYFRDVWVVAKRLRNNDYIVGIISNAVPSMPFSKRSKLLNAPSKLFRPIVLSYRVKSVKPEKRIFEIARKRGRIKFSEMAFFDDRPRNVRAAKRLGIKAFVYKNPARLVKSLRRLGVKI